MKRQRLAEIACMVLVFGAQTQLRAQQTLGSIQGTIEDSSGASLAGATILFEDAANAVRRTVVSNDVGNYSLGNLPAGEYTVTISKSGFQTLVRTGIRVQGDRGTTLNTSLRISSTVSSITVTGTPLLNAVDTTTGYVLNKTQIESIPLATGSFSQLATLSPGVSSELLNSTGTNTGLGNQQIWSNGQRDTSNGYRFNGVDVSNLFNGKGSSQIASARETAGTGRSSGSGGDILTNQSVYDAVGQALPTPAPESLEELQVNAAMYDAASGGYSGAHINQITQAGTQAFHGQAYAYRQTNWLNAAPFFYKRDPSLPANDVNPQLHRYTLGGQVGGPILRDKLFGFLSYQRIRVTDLTSGISRLTVPPGLTDDRSASALAQVANADFGTSLTAEQIDPVALKLLSFRLPSGGYLVPSAVPGVDLNVANSNATLVGRPLFFADQAIANTNWILSQKDQISLKYFYQHDPNATPFAFSNVAGFAQVLDAGTHVFALQNSYTPSTRLSTQQTLGFVREKVYASNTQPLTPDQAGINLFGSNIFPAITINNIDNVVQNSLSFGNSSGYGNQGFFQNRIEPSASAVLLLGKHQIGMGGNYSYSQLNIINRLNRQASLTFNDFSDLLTGRIRANQSQLLIGQTNRYYRVNQLGLYLQDKIQLIPHLTLSAGVRYDWNGPFKEKNGNLFNFDPMLYQYDDASDTIQNDGFIVAGNNRRYHTAGTSDSTLKGRQWGFGPRVGLAWSPASFKDRLVARAGFGLYYDRGELFSYFSPGSGNNISGPFGVTQEPPLVVPIAPPSGATFSNPFGTTAPTPPTGNPADFSQYLPNAAALMGGATAYPFGAYAINNKLPYTVNLSFDLQWQPTDTVALTLGYVGNTGHHEVLPAAFNQPGLATASHPIHGQTSSYGYQVSDPQGNLLQSETVGTSDGGNVDLRVPYLGYGVNSVLYEAVGFSHYNALQAHVDKILSHGLTAGASYTYSHSLDVQSGMNLYYQGANPANLKDSYGNSDFDRTHAFSLHYSYTLPGSGAPSSLTGKLTRGWALQGIAVLQSGQPYSLIDYTGAVGSLYYSTNVNIIDPILPLANGATARSARTGHSGAFPGAPALNASAFGIPLVAPGESGVPQCGLSTGGNPVCDIFETGFGPKGQRNLFRQQPQRRTDMSLVKTLALTERFQLRYTFDVYNVTNTTSFDSPQSTSHINPSYNNFPTYDATMSDAGNLASLYKQPPTGFGFIRRTIGSPRNIQMSLHFTF